MSHSVRVFTITMFILILGADALCRAEERMSFDSPSVMDLSGFLRQARLPTKKNTLIKTDTLGLSVAQMMVAAPQRGKDDPGIISCSEKFTHKDEKKLIAADNKKTVSRAGKSLVVKPEFAPPITFEDWFVSGGDQGEDDMRSFVYLGKMAFNGFHRVEAIYQNDSPGSFFIHPKNGRILYAHNGTDTVALSPDGKRMVVLNDGLNPPFGLVVANMGHDEPTLELDCRCRTTTHFGEITPVFKGWHVGAYVGFDLVLIVQQNSSETTATFLAIPFRFSLKDDGWHVATHNAVDLERVAGLSCSQVATTSK
jgi:hypothetical protein